ITRTNARRVDVDKEPNTMIHPPTVRAGPKESPTLPYGTVLTSARITNGDLHKRHQYFISHQHAAPGQAETIVLGPHQVFFYTGREGFAEPRPWIDAMAGGNLAAADAGREAQSREQALLEPFLRR